MQPTIIAVVSPSGYRASVLLLQGSGDTEQSAWVDALGSFDKKEIARLVRQGWFTQEVSQEQLEELQSNS